MDPATTLLHGPLRPARKPISSLPAMLDNLTQRLARVVKTMRGEARLTEANTAEMLREVRLAMLEADVALPVVRDFIARVKEKALARKWYRA
jgi:signal recognition particle subunit SRP54